MLGGKLAEFQKAPGLLIRGNLDQVRMKDWLGLMKSGAETEDRPQILRELDLHANTVDVYEHEFNDVDVILQREKLFWNAKLTSSEAA